MKGKDEWLERILEEETKEEAWVITITSILQAFDKRTILDKLLNKYCIKGVYNLGSPYVDTGIRLELIHLTEKSNSYINFSIYKGQMFTGKLGRGRQKEGTFILSDRFSSKYERYLEALENWINGGKLPEDDVMGEYEYNSISFSSVEKEHLSPEYYSKKAIKVRKLLKQENIVRLEEVADVLSVRPINNETGKVVGLSDLKYPFNTDMIKERTATSIVLQKNDIILPTVNNIKPFLIIDDLDETIYASQYMIVLRCRNIQPEYLFLYLGSEVCQTVIESQKIGSIISRITFKSAKNIPVIMPTKDEQDYHLQAYILTHSERSYQINEDVETRAFEYWNKLIKKQEKKAEKVEDILSIELLNTLKVHSANQLQKMLQDDWKELNECFRVKAYKATLILAGSILEAVLIDWLSEIKGENYFEKDYMVTDRNGRKKRADLIDYINEIKYIERPHWIDEATKAHEIRKKRNLVHAKLGINSDEINEDSCRMVIDYLRDVIKTRGVEE